MLKKKRLLIGILALLMLAQAMAAPPANHPVTGEPLMIDCLRGTPEAIDGDLSDWNLAAMTPAVLEAEQQIYTGVDSWTGPEDCSGKFYLLWDDVNIYLAVIVKDDTLATTKTGGDIWNADCVEFFLSTLDTVPTDDHTGHWQWGVNADEAKWEWENLANWTGLEPDYMQVASVRTDDGYICEVAMAYAGITDFDFTAGNTIGFHAGLDDTDATDREVQMTWTGNEAHDQGDGFGHMFLSDQRAIAPELSRNPSPENNAADVLRDVSLSWAPGEFAVSHDIYFGTAFDDVNDATRDHPMDVLIAQGHATTTFDFSEALEYGQTYYWRVDEVSAGAGAIYRGMVWNFTVEPFAYAVENVIATSNAHSELTQGPDNLVNGSGLGENDRHSTITNDMWVGDIPADEEAYLLFEFDRTYKLHEMLVWNYNMDFEFVLGFSVKEATLEYSQDGSDWAVLGDVEMARGPGLSTYTYDTIVPFEGVAARYVRMTIHNSYTSLEKHGLSEVRFTYIPAHAREPRPADGAAKVTLDTTLGWRAARDAVSYDVYLGNAPETLAMVGSTTQPSYDPGTLGLNMTYYWRVDALNPDAAVPSWEGNLWSFSTDEYIEIEGFEDYDDDVEAGTTIWQTWIDGFETNSGNGGALVGNDPSPFAELTIVHGGQQSMPMFYGNDSASSFSETDRAFAPAQNWAAGGIKSLSLWFHGAAGNTGQLYVKINETKILYDGDAADVGTPKWQPWNIDLSTVGGNLSNVTMMSIGIEGIGTGVLYVDDIRLYPYEPQKITPVAPAATGLAAHYTFDEGAGTTVADSSGNGNNGTVVGSPLWAAGTINGAMEFTGDDYVNCGNGASLQIRDAITLACWVKIDAFTVSWETILGKGDDSYRMSRGPETGDSIHWGCNGVTGGDLNGVSAVTTNSWRHVALTYDGAQRVIYIDGAEDARVESTGQIDASTYDLYIGENSQQTGRQLGGSVDDVRIYNRALSAEEVAGLAGRQAPMHTPF